MIHRYVPSISLSAHRNFNYPRVTHSARSTQEAISQPMQSQYDQIWTVAYLKHACMSSPTTLRPSSGKPHQKGTFLVKPMLLPKHKEAPMPGPLTSFSFFSQHLNLLFELSLATCAFCISSNRAVLLLFQSSSLLSQFFVVAGRLPA